MSTVPVVFLGTPAFAQFHLQKLIDDEHFHVVGVVSQPDRPAGRKMKLQASAVKQCALDHDIPVITPEKMDDVAIAQIMQWRPEAAVVVAYGQILRNNFLNAFPNKVVNVHGSLLPRWRGAAPIQRAIMEGDKTTGVCLQVMVRKLDAGPVLGSRSISITDQTTALNLHDEMMELGADLLHIEFMDYLRGNLSPVPQDEALVTYAHKIEKSEGKIDWAQSAEVIFNRLRGLLMGPGSFTTQADGKKLKVHAVKPVDVESDRTAGEVVRLTDDELVIQTGQGGLQILEVQPESKSKMSIEDYLRGYRLQAEKGFRS